MKISVYWALLALAFGYAGMSQVKGGPARFEVASIKPSANPNSYTLRVQPTRLQINGASIEYLILEAYFSYADGNPLPKGNSAFTILEDMRASLQNAPSWVTSKHFDIRATTNLPVTEPQMLGPLMQDLLQKRFKLRVHEESRIIAAYELVQDKGGAKLQPARDGSCLEMDSTKAPPVASDGKRPPPICGGYRVGEKGGVEAFHISMADLCRRFTAALDKPVVDKTGLTGTYDNVHLDLTMNEVPLFKRMVRTPPPADPSKLEAADPSGTIFSAVRKLGLRLQPGKGTAKILVIDHIEPPTAN
jgi:uncharacterized protein (TIGR03435 family)